MMVIKLGILFLGGDTVDENIMGTEPTIVREYHRIQLPKKYLGMWGRTLTDWYVMKDIYFIDILWLLFFLNAATRLL